MLDKCGPYHLSYNFYHMVPAKPEVHIEANNANERSYDNSIIELSNKDTPWSWQLSRMKDLYKCPHILWVSVIIALGGVAYDQNNPKWSESFGPVIREIRQLVVNELNEKGLYVHM